MRFAPNTISLRPPLGGNVICCLAGRATVSHLGWSGPSQRDLSRKSMLGRDTKVLRPCGCIHGRIIPKLSTKVGSLQMKLSNSYSWMKKEKRKKPTKLFKCLWVIGFSLRKRSLHVSSPLQTLPGCVQACVTAQEYLGFSLAKIK